MQEDVITDTTVVYYSTRMYSLGGFLHKDHSCPADFGVRSAYYLSEVAHKYDNVPACARCFGPNEIIEVARITQAFTRIVRSGEAAKKVLREQKFVWSARRRLNVLDEFDRALETLQRVLKDIEYLKSVPVSPVSLNNAEIIAERLRNTLSWYKTSSGVKVLEKYAADLAPGDAQHIKAWVLVVNLGPKHGALMEYVYGRKLSAHYIELIGPKSLLCSWGGAREEDIVETSVPEVEEIAFAFVKDGLSVREAVRTAQALKEV